MPSKSKTPNILSAEHMSLCTKRAIGAFPTNPQVTTLDPSVIVQSDNQIKSNLLSGVAIMASKPEKDKRTGSTQPPKAAGIAKAPKVPKKSKPKAKTTSSNPKGVSSANVESAIKQIAGILAVLPQDERFAVMKKINGAFGYKPKDTEKAKETDDDSKLAAVPKVPKTSLNEEFGKSFPGKLLGVTSRLMKQAARSADQKPSSELYELHKMLLGLLSGVRAKETPMPEPHVTYAEFDANETVKALLKSHKIITAAFTEAKLEPPTPDRIFRWGQCLIQGTGAEEMPLEIGTIPDYETWPEAPWFVPRTNREAEERAAVLLASSQKKKEQRKIKKSDNQTLARKRTRVDEEIAEVTAAKDQTSGPAEMEVEESEPSKTT